MNVNNTHLVNKASLSTEIASIKTDMQQLVELSRSIFERVSRLELSPMSSRTVFWEEGLRQINCIFILSFFKLHDILG